MPLGSLAGPRPGARSRRGAGAAAAATADKVGGGRQVGTDTGGPHVHLAPADPDQRMTRSDGSHSMTASGVFSKCADRIELARRSSCSTTFCSWMSLVVE